MRENMSVTEKEVIVIIFLSMLFAICEALSIELNNFFKNYNVFDIKISFNVSVVFFCIDFFIIDLITEIYNDKFASYFIYSKIASQIMFILFGVIGVKLSGIEGGQISQTFFMAPHMFFNSIFSSYFGYKVTGCLMQKLKIKFDGNFLFTRYLSSTIPGEIAFSLIFTILSFSAGKDFFEIINIFYGLIFIKIFFSVIFSVLVIPITNIIKHYIKNDNEGVFIKSLPF